MKRRTFFQLLLACLGLSRIKAKPIHTSAQLAGRDYIDEFSLGPIGNVGPQGVSYSEALMQSQKAFSNHLLSRYEGRAIPPNVVFTQNVGRCRPSYSNAYRPETEKLKSTTKDDAIPRINPQFLAKNE